MGLGVYLTGQFDSKHKKPDEWLSQVKHWFTKRAGELLETIHVGESPEGQPCAFVRLHPCAEDVEISVPDPGRVVVSAKTTTVGPGYHAYLCDLLHQFEKDLAVIWDSPGENSECCDDTGYFFRPDRTALEEEFLCWLGHLARVICKDLSDASPWMISMSVEHRYPHHGPVNTPMGPRDEDWLKAVEADPRRGLDIFPWWDSGLGARFHLGRALGRMWVDIRWRPPLSKLEADRDAVVLKDLRSAYFEDPALAYPWREWRELMGHTGHRFGKWSSKERELERVLTQRADEVHDRPLIGYRRLPVRANLSGGWSIEIPGSFAESWEEDGTWSACDGNRNIWFTIFRFTKPDARKPTAGETLEDAPQPEGELINHRSGQILARAGFAPYEEDGKQLWQLSGRSAIAGELALCNIFITDESDRDWAITVWRSIEHS